jgi:hypothetical protein
MLDKKHRGLNSRRAIDEFRERLKGSKSKGRA